MAFYTCYCPYSGSIDGEMSLASGQDGHPIRHQLCIKGPLTQAEEYAHLKAHILKVLQPRDTTIHIFVMLRTLGADTEHVAQFVTQHFPLIKVHRDETGQAGILMDGDHYGKAATGRDVGAATIMLECFL